MVEGTVNVADVFHKRLARSKVFPASRMPVYIRSDHRDADVAAFRNSIHGPADLALSTADLQCRECARVASAAERSVAGVLAVRLSESVRGGRELVSGGMWGESADDGDGAG